MLHFGQKIYDGAPGRLTARLNGGELAQPSAPRPGVLITTLARSASPLLQTMMVYGVVPMMTGQSLDMAAMLERLSASTGRYKHNDLELRTGEMNPDECANGHAHCQHLLLGSSENIPVAGRRMELGQWQRIFLLELDRPRQRQLVIQVFGA